MSNCRRLARVGISSLCLVLILTLVGHTLGVTSGQGTASGNGSPVVGTSLAEASTQNSLRAPVAAIRLQGESAPGEVVTLRGTDSTGASSYRWIQTHGDPVKIEDPAGSTLRVKIPEQGPPLGFSLVVANSRGMDVASIQFPDRAGNGSLAESRPPHADAGDDQIGIVGRQITLNGSRSEPRNEIGYRWIQIGGPRVRLEMSEGYTYSFVPQAPGIYEFALVVARGSEISPADLITVSIGNPASPFGIDPPRDTPEALQDVARSAIAQVPGGLESGTQLASAFEDVADRMDLYRCYAEVYGELSRRLDAILPSDAVRRGIWDERLFIPLTARIVDGVRRDGLDLRRAETHAEAMTTAQRARLAEMFRTISRGFRATRPGP